MKQNKTKDNKESLCFRSMLSECKQFDLLWWNVFDQD